MDAGRRDDRDRLRPLYPPPRADQRFAPGAKRIKIADKTSNLRSVCASPPAGWPSERIAEYVAWAAAVVDRCRGVDPALEPKFDAALAAATSRTPPS